MIRLKSEYTSAYGTNYTIEIYDDSYVGALIPFAVSGTGHSISLEPTGERRNEPFVSTKVEFFMRFDEVKDQLADLELFFADYLTAPAQTFPLVIKRESSIVWAGFLLPTLVEREDDSYPFFLKLSGTDGIGTLKELPYTTSDTAFSRQTVVEQLFNIISKTGIVPYLDPNNVLKIIHNWWPNERTYSSVESVLELTRTRLAPYIELDGDGNPEETTYFDVLAKLCTNFNFRLIFSAGSYWAIQTKALIESSVVIHTYDSVGAKVTSSLTATPSKTVYTDLIKYTGFVEKYYAPYLEVRVTHKTFDGGSYVFEPGVFQKTIFDVNSNSGVATFVYSGFLEYDITSIRTSIGVPTDTVYVKFRIQIILNNYSLNRQQSFNLTLGAPNAPTSETWYFNTTGSYEIIDQSGPNNNLVRVPFSIPSNPNNVPIPEDGAMNIIISVTDVYYASAGLWNNIQLSNESPSGITDEYFEIFYTGQPSSQIIDTVYSNINNNTTNTEVEKLDIYFGDGPNPNTLGAIQVDSGTNNWVESTAWSYKNATPYVTLPQLLADELMEGQSAVIPKMIGTFKGIVDPHERLIRGARIYAILRCTFNGFREETTGEWFLLETREGTFNPLPPKGKPGRGPSPVLAQERTVSSSFDQAIDNIIPITAPLDNEVEITSINITALPQELVPIYKNGTTLFLVDSYTGGFDEITLSADVALNDKVISVDAFTTARYYVSGSYIVPSIQPGPSTSIYNLLPQQDVTVNANGNRLSINGGDLVFFGPNNGTEFGKISIAPASGSIGFNGTNVICSISMSDFDRELIIRLTNKITQTTVSEIILREDQLLLQARSAGPIRKIDIRPSSIEFNQKYHLPDGLVDVFAENTRFYYTYDRTTAKAEWVPAILAIGYRATPLVLNLVANTPQIIFLTYPTLKGFTLEVDGSLTYENVGLDTIIDLNAVFQISSNTNNTIVTLRLIVNSTPILGTTISVDVPRQGEGVLVPFVATGLLTDLSNFYIEIESNLQTDITINTAQFRVKNS